MFALYYRKDIFEDPKLKEAYQAKFSKPLEVPKTWEDYAQVAQFITDNLAPNVYGAGHFRKAGSPGQPVRLHAAVPLQWRRLLRRRHEGAARLATPGVKTLQNMIAANAASIPGNEELDAVSLWVAWLQGKVAMIYSWPPTGRMSAGYSQSDKAISFVPQSTIAGKVGYAIVPGGIREHAFGFNKCARGGFGEPRGGLSLHAVGVLAAGVARALHAALRAARPVPHLALQVGALRPALPDAPRSICKPQRLGRMSACST